MLKVLSNILCDLDPKVKVIVQKGGICDGVPSTYALVMFLNLGHQLAKGETCGDGRCRNAQPVNAN